MRNRTTRMRHLTGLCGCMTAVVFLNGASALAASEHQDAVGSLEEKPQHAKQGELPDQEPSQTPGGGASEGGAKSENESLADVAEASEETGTAEQPVAVPRAGSDESPVDVAAAVGQPVGEPSRFADPAYLRRLERDDVLPVLQSVPGVYIRDEDGLGLRLHIGMRGSGTQRNAKLALMEDGVLVGPAPYSAPGAYDFPVLTKLVGIEVLKGPDTLRYGPNTVAGAVNLLRRPIPDESSLGIDLGGGTDMYGKAHLYYGGSTQHLGWLIEGVKVRSDGFREIDSDTPVGLDRNDVTARLRLSAATSARVRHEVEVSMGYANELSRETYVGLTFEDFDRTPYRRYAATQLDRLRWSRNHQRVDYRLLISDCDVSVKLYRSASHLDWRKLDRFSTSDPDYSLENLLRGPRGMNATYYDILTGAVDSFSPRTGLIVGSHERRYLSEGAQVDVTSEQHWLGGNHRTRLGLRLHRDHADRHYGEEAYDMRGGRTEPTGDGSRALEDLLDSTVALASYAQHHAQFGPWGIALGLRHELIEAKRVHEMSHVAVVTPEVSETYNVLLPGGSLTYRPIAELELRAGVHKGFVPIRAGTLGSPESSLNYEAGLRFETRRASLQATGFFSDFSETVANVCELPSACSVDRGGLEISGGAVHSRGVEVDGSVEIPVYDSVAVPLRVAYTFQDATYQDPPYIVGSAAYGLLSPRSEVSGLPEHQVYATAGLRSDRWAVEGYAHYTSAMRAFDAMTADELEVEAALLFDAVARVTFGNWGSLYLTCYNLLDRRYVVSRQPLGLRAGAPRRIVLGYKNGF